MIPPVLTSNAGGCVKLSFRLWSRIQRTIQSGPCWNAMSASIFSLPKFHGPFSGMKEMVGVLSLLIPLSLFGPGSLEERYVFIIIAPDHEEIGFAVNDDNLLPDARLGPSDF